MSPEGTGQGGSPTAEGGDKQLLCAEAAQLHTPSVSFRALQSALQAQAWGRGGPNTYRWGQGPRLSLSPDSGRTET